MKSKKKCVFHYDDFSDRLFISRKEKSDVIAGSIRMLNVILDITTDNRVANVELLDASEYLSSLGINPRVLSKLTDAEISFKTIRNGYLIAFILKLGKKVVAVPYNIHTENKKLIVN